jgi:hypothetical protein
MIHGKRIVSAGLSLMLCLVFVWSANRAFSAESARILFGQDTALAPTQLTTAFPSISFQFGPEVHPWYQFLLYKVLTALPEKHVKNLESITIRTTGLSRRGVVAFSMAVTAHAPTLGLSLNPVEFPLEIGLTCHTVAECMRSTLSTTNREFVAVAIHEIGHAIDFGPSTQGTPVSGDSPDFTNGPYSFFNDDPSVVGFYPLCYKTTTLLSRKKCNRNDFVSAYAKTNALEDFAETMTVYVLDGENFLKTATENQAKGYDVLMRKYNFFKDTIFDGMEYHLSGDRMRNLFTTNDATLRQFSLPFFLYKY